MDYDPSQLPDVDAVELVDFKSVQLNGAKEYMRIAKNAPQVRLTGETAQQIAQLWRKLPPEEQMRCHLPPFALRFYIGNELVVQGTVCWQCNNIFVEENGAYLVYKFDGGHPHSQQLLDLLQQIADKSF